MFDHIIIAVSDRDASRRFYELVLATLGREPGRDLRFSEATDDNPVTRNLHVAFAAGSRAEVDAFWQAGIDAGHRSDGEPGLRPVYDENYYGGFLLDPDGNSAEAVWGHRPERGSALIDHLWIGVRDLAAQLRFWQDVAPLLRVQVRSILDERFHVATDDRSFALVHDGRPPTENVHLAFPGDEATVLLDPDGNTIELV